MAMLDTLPDFEPTEQFARDLDARDPLGEFRDEFYVPGEAIYLDGNSLGLLSRAAEKRLHDVLQQWKQLAIGGWLDASPPWFELAEHLGAGLASLLGATADEVIVANSVTVNVHQLLATLYDPHSPRDAILIDQLCFPTDRYAVESHLRHVGKDAAACLQVVPSRDGLLLDEDEIIKCFSDQVQLALLPSVVYTSGQLLDLARLTKAAHQRGIMIGFDCAHSVGVVPHALSEAGVDFAVGCSYKYLNAGPGAIGWLYLNRRHFDRSPGLAGWFGNRKDRQFEMSPHFEPAPGAAALQIGTPPVLSAAPLLGSLELIRRAGMDRIRDKSLALTEFLVRLTADWLDAYGVNQLNLPPHARGGHVALLHPDAMSISRALRMAHVVPDFRPPHIIRLCPAPLYSSFLDCFRALQILASILRGGTYRQYQKQQRVP